MSRKKTYIELQERIRANFPIPVPVYLSSGIADFGEPNKIGFLDFETNKLLNLSLPKECIIIFPINGTVKYGYNKKSSESVGIVVFSESDAFLWAEAVALFLKDDNISIDTSINVMANLGFIPVSLLPRFAEGKYEVAAITTTLQFTTLQRTDLECLMNCCTETINLGCLESCTELNITGLQPSTNYKAHVSIPHSYTSAPFEIMSDASGVLTIPVNTSFAGQYKVRLHENGAQPYVCYLFEIKP